MNPPSHTMILLKLLIERGPLSANQMQEASGLSMSQIHSAMKMLRKHQAMRALDQPYQVTGKGRDWARTREALAERMAKKAAKPKRVPGPPRKKRATVLPIPEMPVVRRIVEAPAHRDSLVAGAIASAPAFQACWGVAHG